VNDALLLQYYHLVKTILEEFTEVKLKHISKGDNIRVDVLSKLANIVCRYGILHTTITECGKQFLNKSLVEFYANLGNKNSFVEHSQLKVQVEVANKVILVELKKRLDSTKGIWSEDLL